MPPIARLLLSFCLVISSLLPASAQDLSKFGDALDAYHKAMDQAQSVYRRGLAEALSEATKVEVYLLDFEVKPFEGGTEGVWKFNLPKNQFPIGPYKSVTRILKTKVLSPEQRKELLPALQAVVGVEKSTQGAMCHFPIHGLRVWAGDRLILETSFCWLCENFALEYPDFRERWIGIQGTKLKEIINALMPIPKAELDRFKKSYPADLQGK